MSASRWPCLRAGAADPQHGARRVGRGRDLSRPGPRDRHGPPRPGGDARRITIGWRSCWRPRARPIPRSWACISWVPACRNGRPTTSPGPPSRRPRRSPSTERPALYRLALELRRPGPARTGPAARAAWATPWPTRGAVPRRRAAYLAAVPDAPVAEALELQRRAAMQFLISGHIDEGLAHAPDGAGGRRHAPARHAATGPDLAPLASGPVAAAGAGLPRRATPARSPPADLTRIDVCWSAGVGLSVVDTIRGADFQARGLLLSLEAGEPSRIARALAMEAAHAASTGGSNRKTTERLLAIGRGPGPPRRASLRPGHGDAGPGRRRIPRGAVDRGPEASATGPRRSSATAAPASPGRSTRPTPSRSGA